MYNIILTLISIIPISILLCYLGIVKGKLTMQEKEINRVQGELENSNSQKKEIEAELTKLRSRVVELETLNEGLQLHLHQERNKLVSNEEKLSLQFQKLANQVLEEKGDRFTRMNKEALEKILQPLSMNINSFKQEVVRNHRETRDHKVALQTELKQIYQVNQKISQDANNLTRAIRGDNKKQGNWGEFILENVLENAGLVEGREYRRQPSFNTEGGKRLQPDVIIDLPKGKNIIIDSKLNLIEYEKYFHASEKSDEQEAIKNHLSALKRHIKNLHDKNYTTIYKLGGIDFVILFIPLESAFSVAIQGDSSLLDFAYKQGVIIASPSTLLATLRTVSHLWKEEYQNRYAVEIAKQSGALYDKFVSFVEDLKKIGVQIDLAQKSYQNASNKLFTGRGNLIKRTTRIKELGVPTTKKLNYPHSNQDISQLKEDNPQNPLTSSCETKTQQPKC